MAVRKIVQIDEEKCNGCGQCIPACHEGAIQLVDGKAKLVSDVYCDGLGDCLGTCPQDAITIIEREAADYDQAAVDERLEQLEAEAAPQEAPAAGGCPGAQARSLSADAGHAGGCPGAAARQLQPEQADAPSQDAAPTPSELQNWPLQLHLVPPTAPYLKGADLLFAADCVGFACPDFHKDLLRGKQLIIACPKLDDANAYLEKLVTLFESNAVNSVEVAHMEVPCCFGLRRLIEVALERAGVDVPLTVTKVGIDGEVQERVEAKPAPAQS